VALPYGAKVQLHSAGGLIWDSCDGRSEAPGWGDVVNDYQFTSAGSAATVLARAESRMKIAGWNLISTSTKPLGPSVTTGPFGYTTGPLSQNVA